MQSNQISLDASKFTAEDRQQATGNSQAANTPKNKKRSSHTTKNIATITLHC
ncbi:hypothetical protein MEO41_25280 [Dolichospermum sp. ST_sed4]|nr:hypothetical protein [Dolichospermum sp. ST_sed4]